MSIPDHFLANVLHAIWTHGPLSIELVHEVIPEASGAEVVEALLTLNRLQVIDRDDSGVDPVYTELPEREHAARVLYANWTGLRHCLNCYYTEDWACDGGCDWVTPILCSACTEVNA